MRITKCIVYDLDTSQLTADDRINDLLKILIEVCDANPEFLDPIDAKRHAFLLRALGCFKPPDFLQYRWGREAGDPVPTAAELKIKALPVLLDHWVLSFFEQSQLVPHYALDTAEFLVAVAQGVSRWEPHRWRIDPLVANNPPYANFDRSFKAAFTRSCGGSVLVGTMPDGFNVLSNYYDRSQGRRQDVVEVASGTQFAFKIKRCHLSEPWDDYRCCMRIQPEFKFVTLGDEFQFIGNIRPFSNCANGIDQGWDWDVRGYLEVPHQWITHEVSVDHERNWTLIPLPTWDATVEEPPPPPPVDNSSQVACVTTTPVPRPIKRNVGVHPVPPAPVCAGCGAELSPAMLVWKPEQRLCTRCKRADKTARR